MYPYTRTQPRTGPMRNKSCYCGNTKTVTEIVDDKPVEVQVAVKYKHCCMNRGRKTYESQWPNNFGNYNPTKAEEKRKHYGKTQG